ncbi:MAG: hypothetical protein K2G60_00625 [Oscillospiraceae bacterium]|nr:hypothetical protein [Oscillospiraceae bacterium]
MKNEIDDSNATIACVGYYNNNIRTGGHAVVITGYYISNEANDINYYDPADGTFNTCSFSEFCNGYVYGGLYDQTCYNNEF